MAGQKHNEAAPLSLPKIQSKSQLGQKQGEEHGRYLNRNASQLSTNLQEHEHLASKKPEHSPYHRNKRNYPPAKGTAQQSSNIVDIQLNQLNIVGLQNKQNQRYQNDRDSHLQKEGKPKNSKSQKSILKSHRDRNSSNKEHQVAISQSIPSISPSQFRNQYNSELKQEKQVLISNYDMLMHKNNEY